MTFSKQHQFLFAITALLFSTLACRAATRLIIPDTPTPSPTFTPPPTWTPSLVPTAIPSVTPTPEPYEASCPSDLTRILDDAIFNRTDFQGEENAFEEDITFLVHYTVVNGELKTPLFNDVKKTLQDEQEDRAAHEEVWSLFKRLIPEEHRSMLNAFTIFTDGHENYLASVNQSDLSPYKWELNVDYADTTPQTNLIYTLIHEQGHLLTLNRDQVTVSLPVYRNPEDEDIYDREANACPQYFTGEGCSNPESYISEFFNRFWLDLYQEWLDIDAEENELTRERLLDDFYDTYQDQFLTDYAPTSPAEDIAESWSFFVLSPKPELTSIANEKLLFFYNYPELVELRTSILQNICAEFQP